ncbi:MULTISPECIES: O-antigen ligase family protein [Shewanella]|uniref:Oligosaccharide repeat unit polymerase n=1 Tax=Shewanella marisflavi TaxID=260364 RepID=A0ABX5WNZ4_9GAMM|nr:MULTISPECIES: O-antigen polymerase [Shewanella]QDF75861.1 oligosaccharide repeat unit polymerase [Shewanella marisflavi]
MKSLSLSNFFVFWIFISILYQAGVSFYTDNPIISLFSQLFIPISIVFSIIVIFKRGFISKNAIFISFFCFFILLSCVSNFYEGKEAFVLLLGTIDNLKFLLVLLIVVSLPAHFFRLDHVNNVILTLVYFIIVFSVFFSCIQQFNSSLIYIFPSAVEFKELYRYGILRVPSIFASVNAFAKIAFLLIPIAYVLKRNMIFAISLALIAFLMTFSRQFLVGLFVSTFLSLVFSGYFRKKGSMKILLVSIVSLSMLVTISIIGQGNSKNEVHDGKFLSIPDKYIRLAVAVTSVKASIDNPIFGVGSGYFGGNIGKKFVINSELEKYGLMEIIPYFDLGGVYYTDTLWPQLLGEYGVFGFVLIIYAFYLWFRRLYNIREPSIRFVALILFFQYIIVGFTGPVFNYSYFSIPILILSIILVAQDENINRY